MPPLYQALGVYLPLITTNCAVLGVALTNVQKSYSIGAGVVNGVATAVGFLIAIVLMAGIREKSSTMMFRNPFRNSDRAGNSRIDGDCVFRILGIDLRRT